MRLRSVIATLFCLFLVVCGGIAGRLSSGPSGTVHAAGFTVRDMRGGYGFSMITLGAVASGVLVADGNGNLKGQETVNVTGNSCHGTLTGSYTIDADGSGAATLFLTEDAASSAKNCQPLATHYSLALTNGGQEILIAEQDATIVATGFAIRQ